MIIAALFIISTNWKFNFWMDRQTVILYNGILHSDKKETTTDTLGNMSEFQMQYAKWKKARYYMIPHL